MLDIRFIRENAEVIQEVAKAKGIDVSVTELLDVDAQRLALLRKVEELRHQRNTGSARIAQLLKEAKTAEANQWKEQVRHINEELARFESQLSEVENRFNELMLLIPNIVSPDTPPGESDADNVEIKRVGEPPKFDFEPKDHVTLAENLGILDIPRGVKVAGSRGYFLKNAGLQLHRAVQQLAIDLLANRGFTVMDVPLLVREEALVNTGFFPTGRDQTYHLEKDQKWLIGTSEAPLVSYYANEIVDVDEPIRLAAVSMCFRREAGSAGRDVHGLYRVHQFSKVEQVVLCRNDLETSLRMFEEITKNAEDILAMLELPYRIVAVCTGDLSQKNYKQYDIETWMPSRNSYGETHSSSILLDFQARRSNIRYRDEGGKLQYCHTLNNTAVASPRILIPLLENHQRPDGSIYIPKALRKYMNGLEELKP
jgi:seryl-tRNA synthetase